MLPTERHRLAENAVAHLRTGTVSVKIDGIFILFQNGALFVRLELMWIQSQSQDKYHKLRIGVGVAKNRLNSSAFDGNYERFRTLVISRVVRIEAVPTCS